MKIGSRILVVIFLASLFAACAKKDEDVNSSALSAISLTQTVAPAQQSTSTLAASSPALIAVPPQRIQFKPGAASTRIQDVIPAAGREYVLFAMAGDEMTINLTTAGSPASSPACFILNASDGTKLVKVEQSHAAGPISNRERPSRSYTLHPMGR